jgi:hypothetical protein
LPPPRGLTLELINLGISGLFAIELILRWIVASSTARFWRNYWLDWLAVVPLFQVLGLPPGIRFCDSYELPDYFIC